MLVFHLPDITGNEIGSIFYISTRYTECNNSRKSTRSFKTSYNKLIPSCTQRVSAQDVFNNTKWLSITICILARWAINFINAYWPFLRSFDQCWVGDCKTKRANRKRCRGILHTTYNNVFKRVRFNCDFFIIFIIIYNLNGKSHFINTHPIL